jgi:hypothetical protein
MVVVQSALLCLELGQASNLVHFHFKDPEVVGDLCSLAAGNWWRGTCRSSASTVAL